MPNIRGGARYVLVLLPFLAILSACSPTPREAVQTFTGETMGTTYTVKVAGDMSGDQREAVQKSFDEALARIDRSMSTWREDSELSRFNASTSTEPMKVSPELIEVLQCAKTVSEASGGTFDITVGPLVEAWGFGPQGEPDRIPSDPQIAALREQVGHTKLEIDPAAGTIRKTTPGLHVDVGAIAPGYGSDLLGEALESHGYTRYMVELGGEVRAGEAKPDGSPWRIAIERPDVPGRAFYSAVSLVRESLSTSGDYRDYYERDGVRYSHAIDPRTGRPIAHNLASVSVICKGCKEADAWATAIDVLGPDEGFRLAEAQGIPALFLVRKAPGEFEEKVTSAFKNRNEPVANPAR